MASNVSTLTDEDGDHSDWIEIYNPDVTAVNLKGYFLTDNAANLEEWQFPDAIVPAGGYVVVFASGKDRAVAGQELHTNFSLDAAGEYLGLIAPDGTTVVSDYSPSYPTQLNDISYGVSTDVVSTSLITTNAQAKVLVPTNGDLGSSWTGPIFDDSSWLNGTTGIGFDTGTAPPQIPGWTVRMVDVGQAINDVTTAQQIADGPLPGGYTVQLDKSQDYPTVNLGSGGAFSPDEVLPNGQQSDDQYVLQATANVFIPAGTWTFNVGSDDGFRLIIPGATFSNRSNENYTNVQTPVPGNSLYFSAPRGHSDTSGTITVGSQGLQTTITLYFYENGGGDDVELTVAPGAQTFNPNFVLLADGALPGWSVKTTSSAPPPDYTAIPGLINTNVQSQMLNKNATAYIRIPINEVENPGDFDSLQLRMKYDDGFVAYLNGVEIARRNAPGALSWDSAASAEHADTDALVYEDINVALPPGLLNQGIDTNVLAIQALNISSNDADMLIQPELLGLHTLANAQRYFVNPTPGGVNDTSSITDVVADTKFDHSRGFYNQPFQLTISTDTQGAQIRYTVDGSEPTATTGIVYTGPITISQTSTIRAAAFKPGALSTNVDTETYIFTADVIRQSPNGQTPANWPASWGSNTVDYGMDPDVVNNPAYANEVQQDLLAIPTISIVMDINDLVGPNGIYSNPGNDGRAWERPASMEVINPDGSKGVQIDMGIRLRGGFSRSTGNPKHAFRLFFRGDYGAGRLNYPLAGPDGPSSFNKIDLRTAENYSWSFQGDSRNIFTRDESSRDMQLEMGDPGSAGAYYHLYINGQYWGVYNSDERPSADWGADHLGGDPANFDVIKPAPDAGYTVYATDGNMVAWTNLWNGLMGDMTNNTNYFKLQGLNPDGTRNVAYDPLLDVDNLIDYMLVIFYAGNLDAPLSNFLSNTNPNNFFAVRDRTGASGGFKFVVHDAEHTLLDVNEDRTGPFNTIGTDPASALARSNPQYMFQLLEANPEFRLRVADKIHKFMFNNSVLTPTGVNNLLTVLRSQLEGPIVDESARWGDAKTATPLTRSNFDAEYDRVQNSYVPQRTQIVFNQLKADNLYPNTAAPEFNQLGGTVGPNFNLTISNPGGAGTIYYTLDGSDPRMIGGAVSAGALVYSAPVAINKNVTVTARILNGGEWSAETQFTFHVDLSALKVTELMYNPPAPPAGSPYTAQDFEYVELQNTGSTSLDLTGVSFTNGITYAFPAGSSIAAGQRIILAKNAAAFATIYPGVAVFDVYTGSLDNNGEQVTLSGPGITIADFTYSDGWYPQTDGGGYSLVAVNLNAPMADWSTKGNWRASNPVNGGPGIADPGINDQAVVVNEVMTNTAAATGDWIELKNTTNAPIDVSGWWVSDTSTDLKKYQIQPGSIIPAGGFLVLTEADQFGKTGAPGVNTVFGLSSAGEEVFVSSNDGANVGGYREHVDFGASAPEVTFGRYTKSTGGTDFTAMSAPTMGSDNALPAVGPVVMSEMLYHPAGTGPEFIELQNLTASDVPLYDVDHPANAWMFNEGVDFTFPANASIPANGFALVVGIDPATFRSTYGVPANIQIFGPYTGTLADGGENVKLSKPGLADPITGVVPYITVDQVHYSDSAPWPTESALFGASLTRLVASGYGNDAGNWTAGPVGGTPGLPFIPPAAPRELSASSASANTIHLSWLDMSIGEDGFLIERSSGGGAFTQVGVAGANATSYDDSSNITPGVFYTYRVRAYNNAGKSLYSNTISASTAGATTLNLINITDTWKYNQSGNNLGTGWIATSYNDSQSGWSSGGGLLYVEGSPLPAPKTTQLQLTGPGKSSETTTFYFRIHFNLSMAPAVLASLQLRTVLDDGAAVYLNGDTTPIFTLGMPATFNSTTFANRTVDNAIFEGPFELLPTNNPTLYTRVMGDLKQGDNVLAVEVHQVNATSSDIVWGATLTGTATVPSVNADIVNVMPDPRTDPVGSINISFSEPVTGFDLSDLRLTRNGGNNLLTASQTLTTSDGGKNWVLGNLTGLTWVAGNYDLVLSANNSGIAGSPGHAITADAIDSFTVTTTEIHGQANASNAYTVRMNGANIEIYNGLVVQGNPAYTAPMSDLTSLAIDGGNLDDTVLIASPLPFLPTFTGGGGTDTLRIGGGAVLIGDDLAGSGIENFQAEGSAVVNLGASQNLGSLTVMDSALVRLQANGGRWIQTGGLTLGPSARLDLINNDLIVGYGATSPLSMIRQYTQGAQPQLLASDSTNADVSQFGRTLAVFDNANTQFNSFDGLTLPNFNQVLVKYTYFGDANLDGKVTPNDYAIVDGNIGQDHDWGRGDLNGDGDTTPADYALIDGNIGAGNGTASGGPQLAVIPTQSPAPAAAAADQPALAALFSTTPVAAAQEPSDAVVISAAANSTAATTTKHDSLFSDDSDVLA